MNGYGWYFWIRGAEERQIEGKLLVASIPRNELAFAVIMILGTLAVGYFLVLTLPQILPIGIV